MNIKRIKLADVKPAAYNPRRQLKPGEKEYEALKASISRWSLVEPLVVNLRTGNLVGGHQRYNVLLDLGSHGGRGGSRRPRAKSRKSCSTSH